MIVKYRYSHFYFIIHLLLIGNDLIKISLRGLKFLARFLKYFLAKNNVYINHSENDFLSNFMEFNH